MIQFEEIVVGLKAYYTYCYFNDSCRITSHMPPAKCKVTNVYKVTEPGDPNQFIKIKLEIYNDKGDIKKIEVLEIGDYYIKNEIGGRFLFENKKEASEFYNAQVLNQLDKLQNYYETKKEYLTKKLIKI